MLLVIVSPMSLKKHVILFIYLPTDVHIEGKVFLLNKLLIKLTYFPNFYCLFLVNLYPYSSEYSSFFFKRILKN